MNKTLMRIIDIFKPVIKPSGGSEIHNVNRTLMAQTLGKLGFKEGAEVGVAEGYHAKVLLDNIPSLKLHCIDVWERYEGYDDYPNITEVYKEALERLHDYKVVLYKKFSIEAVKRFSDNSLDFVYIDGAHDFLNVAIDICLWSKKVRPGGIVFGHDFKRAKKGIVHVKDVIPAYMYAHGITPWFILTNDIRDDSFGRDNPGFLFVREEGQKL